MRCINVLVEQNLIGPLLEKIDLNINRVNHRNNSNYVNFEKRLYDYDAFHIIVDETNDIIAMSGLYNGGIYPSNIVRALDRTYYFNWNKGNSVYQKHNRYNTTYFWPEQCKIAKEKGYSHVFFSVQDLRRRNAGSLVAGRTNPKAVLFPGMYNTCRKYGKDNTVNMDMLCWQNVYVHQFKPDAFDLPNISLEEYKERYINESIN